MVLFQEDLFIRQSEPSNNAANYSAAVGNLSGGDQYTSKMYWDK